MGADLKGILDNYAALVPDLDPLLFLARDRGLQESMVSSLEAMWINITQERTVAAREREEDIANILLGLGCLVNSVMAELRCYILLKEDEPDQAWDKLINAQSSLAAAMRAHHSFEYLGPKAGRLRDLERFLFPPQSFLSAGLIVGRQVCSICQSDYASCDHVAGRPYCGQFCTIILKDVTPDHVALVDEPANRHCRVTAVSVPGGRRNKMSWIVTPGEPPPNAPPGALVAESVVATIHDFGGEWPEATPNT